MRALVLTLLLACSGSSPQTPDVDASVGSGGDGGMTQLDGSTQTATCDAKTAQPLDATWTITVGAQMRQARVHVPASYDPSKRTPIVINIHGRTSNGSQQATISRMIEKADAAGFIAIHPEAWGSPTSWNAGGGCCDPAAANNIDDGGFMRKLLDEAEARLCVDPARIYVAGLSNGGYLAHRVACELADRVAAVGAVAGLLSLQTCAPTRPMPIWLAHGTADTLVSYDWVDETVNYWKVKNGCTSMMQTYQQGVVTCVAQAGCTAGAHVELCTVQNGGHQWFGGVTVPFLGNNTNDVVATDALWNFFVAHPKP